MSRNPRTKSKVDPNSNQATTKTNLSYILNPVAALRAIWSPDNGLTSSQAAVLSSLVIHADAEGKCWPSQERIAACAKLKRTATKEALTRLEKKNLVH
jgi:DNA-binding MarR family transcriptional regulator